MPNFIDKAGVWLAGQLFGTRVRKALESGGSAMADVEALISDLRSISQIAELDNQPSGSAPIPTLDVSFDGRSYEMTGTISKDGDRWNLAVSLTPKV